MSKGKNSEAQQNKATKSFLLKREEQVDNSKFTSIFDIMPPFQCETTDLHYGVVVNSRPTSSSVGSKETIPVEASTSPLLLDTETRSSKDIIQAEHEQFEQEALQVRRLKSYTCCFKIALALSMLPTICLCTVAILDFSPLVVMVTGGLWTQLFRTRATPLPPSLVWAILIVNVTTLSWMYQKHLWDAWIVIVAGHLNVLALFYYYRVRQSKPVLERGSLRQKELFFTYMGTIKSVAKRVCRQQETTSNPPTATELREFYTSAPSEGFYADGSSQLFLLFPPCESPKGWWIRGARKGNKDDRVESIVLEGFVSPTYEVYWTEGTLNGKENILYYGKFAKPNQFQGEWLSYKGKRCHQYTVELSRPASPDNHLGVDCSACGRSALPGMCYVAKDRKCCYCQACVENDSNLIEEEQFVGLQLPEVSWCKSEDQQYDPPNDGLQVEDLESGMALQK